LAKKRGISDTKLALINLLQKEKFRAVPQGERVLFLPHCLRKPKGCRGETTEDGLICKHCSPDCAVNQLTSYAASKGYKCFVVPGGEMVFNLVEKHRPKAILGVACNHEMAQAADRIGSRESTVSFAYQGVPLTKTGCVDTRVDIAAVKSVLDMEPDPTPVKVGRSPSASIPRWSAWRIGSAMAASIALILAGLVILPAVLSPTLAPGSPGQPELSFSKPSTVYTVDADGKPVVDVTVEVQNIGHVAARGIKVRATAFYCAQPFEQDGGGSQEKIINRSIPAGSHEDVTLRVRVNSCNDTSIRVERTVGSRTEVIAYLESKKPVFIREARITGYTTGIPGLRQANVSIMVFNSKEVRGPGSLTIIATSYTSLSTQRDSEEVKLDSSLGRDETWSVTVPLYVPEVPSIEVQLFENGGSTPIDTTSVNS
jgi:hypothetical protein